MSSNSKGPAIYAESVVELVQRGIDIGENGTAADYTATGIVAARLNGLGRPLKLATPLPDRDALVASILAARFPGDLGEPPGPVLGPTDGHSTRVAGLIADQILADAGVSR